jgi:hypothetical protein
MHSVIFMSHSTLNSYCYFFCQFSKETGRYIEESKLRVVLVSASDSLEEQPTNGVHNTEPAIEVPVLKEMSNVENKVPAIPKEVLHPLEQTPKAVTKIASPVKETQSLREIPVPVKETPGLTEIPVPVEETPGLREVPVLLNGVAAVLTESPSPKKDSPAITIEHSPASTIEHAPAIAVEHAPAITIEHAPAIAVEPPPPSKQITAVFKESPPLEETPPEAKEAVMLSARGFFNVQNHQLSHVSFCYRVLVHHIPVFYV